MTRFAELGRPNAYCIQVNTNVNLFKGVNLDAHNREFFMATVTYQDIKLTKGHYRNFI